MSLAGRVGGGGRIRAELWVRECAPYGAADRVGAVHERLRRLEERGAVTDVDVHVWGRSIGVADRDSTDTADGASGVADRTSSAVADRHSTGIVDSASTRIADGATPSADAPRAKVDEFVSWARREGYSLEPAFEIRKRESELDPRTDTVLTLPLVCVALYDDEELLAVFPHAEDGGVRSVEDCLERLDRERVAPNG